MWLVKNTMIGRWIYTYFKKRNPKIKTKINQVEKEYQQLISEYRLIQLKQSKLKRADRDKVEARVLHLIGKGHIKIN